MYNNFTINNQKSPNQFNPKKMATLLSGHDQFLRSINKRRLEIDFQQTLIAILPQHLIIDHILPRLPVKTLIRFKIVCKLWFSIISSFEFAETHLKFSSLCPKFIVLSEDYSFNDCYKLFLLSCDYNNNDNNNNNVGELVRLDLDCDWVFNSLDIVGCCNGLLCLYLEEEDKYGQFRVWNPVTRQCREIMNPYGETFAIDYGFGYASLVDDYKIVALFSRKDGYGYCYVFSLRLGVWKRIDDLDGVTVVINDTLFWVRSNLNDWHKLKRIVAYDLVDERLKEIPWMKCFSHYSRVDFFVMKECVSLLCRGDHGSDVWVLKRDGESSFWERLFSVNVGGMSFLNFMETGKCLVKGSDQLKVVDSRHGACEETRVGVRFSGQITGSAVYVESFVSPFLPSLKRKSSNPIVLNPS